MSNGDDADDGSVADDADTAGDGPSAAEIEAALDEAEEELAAAETEADLDDVEATLTAIETDLDAADLPEPDDEDDEDPREELEGRLDDLRADLEDARGPYVEDVTAELESARETIESGEWTEDGEDEVVAAVDAFLADAGETLDQDLGGAGSSPSEAANALADAADEIGATDLDPDADAETIAALLDAAETLRGDLDDAEEWADLTVREQLDAQGFYDVLDPKNRKDFPPEWTAIKIYAEGHEPEPILTALEMFESDFMEENILNALERFAPEEAFEPLHERAQKRAKHPIRILGRIGDDRACDTLHDFLGGGDVALEKVTLRALGAIGSEESTQPIADRLVADNPEIRSTAARSLGLLGDTRAIEPLADVLAEDDADEVRASAAWALNRIGTREALDEAAAYADDRSYIVQAEAEKAAGA